MFNTATDMSALHLLSGIFHIAIYTQVSHVTKKGHMQTSQSVTATISYLSHGHAHLQLIKSILNDLKTQGLMGTMEQRLT